MPEEVNNLVRIRVQQSVTISSQRLPSKTLEVGGWWLLKCRFLSSNDLNWGGGVGDREGLEIFAF